MNLTDEYYSFFRRCCPTVVRNEDTAREIISSCESMERRDGGKLAGLALIDGDTVILLAVDPEYRNRGIGTELLDEAEKRISFAGYNTIRIGAGRTYLAPGVPMRSRVYDESPSEDDIYPELDDSAYHFFVSRGYTHSWDDCSCFDMRTDSIGDGIEPKDISGISFRIAGEVDIPSVCRCVDDAHDSFTKYYAEPDRYTAHDSRVLIAEENGETVGAVIIGFETELPETGSIGCTAVRESCRHRGIATELVRRAAVMCRDVGMKRGFLGYTYSGLDRLYGRAGYRICQYYMMAEKKLK